MTFFAFIEYGRVVTDNPSRPHGFGQLNLETAVPFQKNPNLSAFFRAIDRADELGSGMRKLKLWGKKYGGKDPQLIEGDNFRMILTVPEFAENPANIPEVVTVDGRRTEDTPQVEAHDEAHDKAHDGAQSGAESGAQSESESGAECSNGQVTTEVTTEVKKLLGAIIREMTRKELQEVLRLKNDSHFRKQYLAPAMETGLIKMTIPNKPNSRLQKYRLTDKGRKIIDQTRFKDKD